jgi:hypothetical protein
MHLSVNELKKGSNHFYLECTPQLVFTETPIATTC